MSGLGQLVERLVRAHTNIAIDQALTEARPKLLLWYIELVFDEPEPELESINII